MSRAWQNEGQPQVGGGSGRERPARAPRGGPPRRARPPSALPALSSRRSAPVFLSTRDQLQAVQHFALPECPILHTGDLRPGPERGECVGVERHLQHHTVLPRLLPAAPGDGVLARLVVHGGDEPTGVHPVVDADLDSVDRAAEPKPDATSLEYDVLELLLVRRHPGPEELRVRAAVVEELLVELDLEREVPRQYPRQVGPLGGGQRRVAQPRGLPGGREGRVERGGKAGNGLGQVGREQ